MGTESHFVDLFTPEQNFSIPDAGSRAKKAQDPENRFATKNLNIFNPNNCYLALENMIQYAFSGSRIWNFSIPDSRSRGQTSNGSRIRTTASDFSILGRALNFDRIWIRNGLHTDLVILMLYEGSCLT
jgi:hypothetical protein